MTDREPASPPAPAAPPIVPAHVTLREAARALGPKYHTWLCWASKGDPRWARLGAWKDDAGHWRVYEHVIRALVARAPQAMGLARPRRLRAMGPGRYGTRGRRPA